jgi:hypothetical protein
MRVSIMCNISFLCFSWYKIFMGFYNLCRAISTIHSIFITAMSLYLVFCSDLFSDNQSTDPITVRSSSLSTFALGVRMVSFFSFLSSFHYYNMVSDINLWVAYIFPMLYCTLVLIQTSVPELVIVKSAFRNYIYLDIMKS